MTKLIVAFVQRTRYYKYEILLLAKTKLKTSERKKRITDSLIKKLK